MEPNERMLRPNVADEQFAPMVGESLSVFIINDEGISPANSDHWLLVILEFILSERSLVVFPNIVGSRDGGRLLPRREAQWRRRGVHLPLHQAHLRVQRHALCQCDILLFFIIFI